MPISRQDALELPGQAPNSDRTDAMSQHRSSRLRILIVSPFFPYPPSFGFVVRTFNLARQLSERHDVTVLSFIRAHQKPELPEASRLLRLELVSHEHTRGVAKRAQQMRVMVSRRPFAAHLVASADMQLAIDRICGEQHFDLIQVESCTMAQYRFPEKIPVVVDEHNIESELRSRLVGGESSRVRRAYNWIEGRRFRRIELDAWRRASGCVVTSEREVDQVNAAAPATRVAVVPNGVDLDRFRLADPPVDDTVVFNATFDYRPNLDGAEYLVDEIWPLVMQRWPAAELQLVGKMPEATRRSLTRPGVELTGEVDQVQPYLARAAVVAIPIQMGGGTRLKVLEALAMGKATVSTSVGCEGIAVVDGTHLVKADSPDTFAQSIVELLADRGRGRRLGLAGRSLIEDRYSWQAACDRLDLLYSDILAAEPREKR